MRALILALLLTAGTVATAAPAAATTPNPLPRAPRCPEPHPVPTGDHPPPDGGWTPAPPTPTRTIRISS